jgi:hypothetical protein
MRSTGLSLFDWATIT